MKQKPSSRKTNEEAREVIASILLYDIRDPKLSLVTITGCEVSFDRAYCNVYYTTEPKRYASTAKAFEKANGAIRSLMAQRLSWRQAPELRFILDESVDQAERIARALERDAPRNQESAALAAAADAEAAAADVEVAEDTDGQADADGAAEQEAAPEQPGEAE